MDASSLKVTELRRELRARGLSASGDKAELVARLSAALREADDDALEDELDLTGFDDAPPADVDVDATLASPAAIADSPPAEPPPAKKIVLNRSVTATATAPTPVAVSTPVAVPAPIESVAVPAPAPVPNSKPPLDARSRLELRAKRFGLPASGDAAKEARKARFGGAASSPAPASSVTATASLDTLKRRAERFGVSVSKVMVDIENRERMERRKAKFGLIKS